MAQFHGCGIPNEFKEFCAKKMVALLPSLKQLLIVLEGATNSDC
jgi:hypothetical protein